MRVTVKGVSKLAIESGLPESIVERHIEAIVNFTCTIAQKERKLCKNAIRAWYFSKNVAKVPLFDILCEEENDLV